MNWDELKHDDATSTCVCKDPEAHRTYCLDLIRKRMEFLDRIRSEMKESPLLGVRDPLVERIGIDWELIPKALTDAVTEALANWVKKDRVGLGFSLIDLAAVSLIILEEISHWRIENERVDLFAAHLRTLAARMGEETTSN